MGVTQFDGVNFLLCERQNDFVVLPPVDAPRSPIGLSSSGGGRRCRRRFWAARISSESGRTPMGTWCIPCTSAVHKLKVTAHQHRLFSLGTDLFPRVRNCCRGG